MTSVYHFGQWELFVVVRSLTHIQLCDPLDCTTPGFHPSLSPGVCSDSFPLNQGCHPTTSSSVTYFSSFPQSFLPSGSFPVSMIFASGGQILGTSALATVLPMNMQAWFPLTLTDLISLLSRGLSRVFSNTTVEKQHFFGTQLSLWSGSHIHNNYWEKP